MEARKILQIIPATGGWVARYVDDNYEHLLPEAASIVCWALIEPIDAVKGIPETNREIVGIVTDDVGLSLADEDTNFSHYEREV